MRSSKFFRYKAKVDGLKKEFDEKESSIKGLVNIEFEAPQIIHDRFMEVIDNCSNLFNQQYESVLKLIDIVR